MAEVYESTSEGKWDADDTIKSFIPETEELVHKGERESEANGKTMIMKSSQRSANIPNPQ